MTIGTNGDFKTHLESRGLSPHTIRAFTSDVRGFETFLAGEQPTEDRAEAFLANEKRRGLSNKTCARKRTSLLAYAHFLGKSWNLPSIRPEQKLPEALSEVEAKAVLEAARHTQNGERDRLIVEIIMRTGLRSAELLALSADDISDEGPIMWVSVVQGKGSKDRRIPIVSKSLQTSLKRYVKGMAPLDPLFPMKSRNLRKLVARIGREAGLSKRLHPHMLRHTSATMYLRKGANLESVRKTLGHESLSTTQKYLALTDEDVARDLAKAAW